MKRKYKTCRVLIAAKNESGVEAIMNALRGVASRGELAVSKAMTISQVRNRIAPYSGDGPPDILIIKLPLEDEAGIEQILDMVAKSSRLQAILMVRRDAYEQISYRCRSLPIFVLSLPAQVQIMAEAVRFMMAAGRRMADSDEEVMRLRRKLSEIGYITRAKCLLIQYRAMSEEEAHYYLEREAMDRCVSKKEIALEIIDSAEAQATGRPGL